MNRAVPALVAALLLLLLSVAQPVAAAPNNCNAPPRPAPVLDHGTASPSSGTPSSTITFSVRYRDVSNCAPTSITVTVAGSILSLTGTGTDYVGGVTYRGTRSLSVGSHAYVFNATSGTNSGTKSADPHVGNPSRVVITAPTPPPTPKPTPPPTPKPTPPPTPVPAPPAAPPATPRPAQPAPTLVPAPITTPVTTTTPTPTAEPTAEPTTSAASSPSPSPSASPSPSGVAHPHLHDSWVPGPGRGPGSQGGEPIHGPPIPGSTEGLALPFGIVAYLAATAAGLGLFLGLVRRQRRPAPASAAMILPDLELVVEPTLAAPAATAAALPADLPAPDPEDAPEIAPVSPLPPMRELIPPVDFGLLADPDEERAGPTPDEAGIPRWLRPSVRAARGTGPVYRPRGG